LHQEMQQDHRDKKALYMVTDVNIHAGSASGDVAAFYDIMENNQLQGQKTFFFEW